MKLDFVNGAPCCPFSLALLKCLQGEVPVYRLKMCLCLSAVLPDKLPVLDITDDHEIHTPQTLQNSRVCGHPSTLAAHATLCQSTLLGYLQAKRSEWGSCKS